MLGTLKTYLGAMVFVIMVSAAGSAWGFYKNNQTLRNTINNLETEIASQKLVIEMQDRLVDISAAAISKIGEGNAESQRRTEKMAAELANLRTQEQSRSLSAPFEAGNDADDRRRNILLRFSGERASNNSASEDPSGDPIGTGGAEPSTTAP